MKTTTKKSRLEKKIALVYRPETVQALSLGKALAGWLKDRGYQVFTAPDQKTIPGTTLIRKNSEIAKMRLIVVLGGDGTYLKAVRMLDGQKIPILGVNLGSLGFLTPTRVEELFTTVEATLDNKMELHSRSMIQVQLWRMGKKIQQTIALNDVVIERGSLSQLINIGIHCEDLLVSEIKADGLVISSPTGSTAYNLAAGGPLLHPDVRAIAVTPVAAHSLTSRPLIFPDQAKLRFRLLTKSNHRKDQAHFVVDGVKLDRLSEGDEIVIERSPMEHLMVQDPSRNYFHLLREKLKFGDRS